MDGASGAFAVVSLAIQLFEIAQETSKFVKGIGNAPSELIRLGETLDQLGSVLGYVRQLLEQQLLVLRLPGSPIFILEALQICERRLKPLKEIVNKAKDAPNDCRTKRVWKSLRFVMKKEQIEELQSQLRDAKSDLQFAVSANSWQLQMHHLEVTSRVALLNTSTVEYQPPADVSIKATVSRVDRTLDYHTVRSEQAMSYTVEQTDQMWYKGILGSVRIHRRLKRSSHSPKIPQDRTLVLLEEDSFVINPSFMRRAFELRFCNSFGRISRSLSIYPVMMNDDPIFRMCQKGDMHGMQFAFSSGSLSPFVLDDIGRTLLHHAATYFHSDLCSWLLQLGVNPDTWSSDEQTALQRVALPGIRTKFGGDLTSFATPIVDTLRVLSQAQTEFSPDDMERFTWLYSGPPSGVEFLLLHNTNLAGTLDQDEKEKSALAFATAVCMFGDGFVQWESLIRKLIQEGVDIHGQVRGHHSEPWYPDSSLATPGILGTPLDELFGQTNTPFEAQVIGKSWLRILASEGVNILAYLEKEIALHTARHLLTLPTYLYSRKLIFQLGDNPGVWWDWELDPKSGAIIVREVYKSLNLTHDIDSFALYQIETLEPNTLEPDPWPWGYRDWCWTPWYRDPMPASEFDDMISRSVQRRNLGEDRAARRMARRSSKLRRVLGIKNASQMPGAWPV